MVQLEEVPDDELNQQQPGPKEDDDEWDTDTGRRNAMMDLNVAPLTPS
jgi:hypothetical protein